MTKGRLKLMLPDKLVSICDLSNDCLYINIHVGKIGLGLVNIPHNYIGTSTSTTDRVLR